MDGQETLATNVIVADFERCFRLDVVHMIKREGGPKRTVKRLIEIGQYHPSFAAAIVRSICRKEGW